MKQRHMTVILLICMLNISQKSWKYVPRYYKTLAFISFVNSFYYYLCRNYLLWEFRPKLISKHWLRSIHILFVTPSLALLSLTNFPNRFFKQVLHISKWTLVSTLGEYVVCKMKLMEYKHGWNIYWSSVIFFILYVYSYLHTKKPVETWILSV